MSVVIARPPSLFLIFWLPALVLLAGVLAITPLSPLLLAIAAITGALLLVRWPWLIWLGIAATLPVSSGMKFGPASVTDLLLAIACALWFANGVRRKTLRLQGSLVVSLLLVYISILYLSLLTAVNLGEATVEVVKWLEVVIVLLLVRAMVTKAQASWLVAALLFGGVSQALLGLYQFIFRIGPSWFIILGRFMRASGSFHQPNPYAGYLGLCLPVAASLALWAWGEVVQRVTRRKQSSDQLSVSADVSIGRDQGSGVDRDPELVTDHWSLITVSALFYTLATGLTALALLASWSRGGWFGAAVGVGIVLILRSRLAALMGVVVVLLTLVALLLGSFKPGMMPAPLVARLQEVPAYFGLTDIVNEPVNDDNFAVIERVAHWVAAVRMWEKAPWLGVGPGNYAVVYPSVHLPRWDEPLGHAHNIYLNVLAETGILGLGAYSLLWITVIGWVWRCFRQTVRRQQGWNAALTIGVLGVIGHLSVHNVFDNLFVQGMYIQIGLWLALVAIVAAPDAALSSG
ncbi:MAG: O-antigen ligase family protein [Caldilineaceae bacterium]